jgi:hypothetical protein
VPIFDDIDYHVAQPTQRLGHRLPGCAVSNRWRLKLFLELHSQRFYSGLEGKKTAPTARPMTCGEVASQMVNQTMFYMVVEDDH